MAAGECVSIVIRHEPSGSMQFGT